MEIFYNNQAIPTIVVDGIAYNFNMSNRGELVAQLSMNPEYIPEVKNKILEYVQSFSWENFSAESDSYSNIRSFIRVASELNQLNPVIDVIEDAESTSIMLSTPQPYDSWIWNGALKKWIPPVVYPHNAPEDIYMWDEDGLEWVPLEQKPHASWNWNRVTLQYEPPIPYPVDAKENQFIWDEQNRSWALNDQVG
jgi:hypothetical protein